MTKRHAKPTALQLSERTYRKVLFIEKVLADAAVIHVDNKTEIEAIGMRVASIVSTQKRIAETVRTLADHCARLLREKETLQRQLYAVQQLKEEAKIPTLKPAKWEDFISGTCPFADEHKPNIRCLICGNLNISEDNYNPNWHKPDGEP